MYYCKECGKAVEGTPVYFDEDEWVMKCENCCSEVVTLHECQVCGSDTDGEICQECIDSFGEIYERAIDELQFRYKRKSRREMEHDWIQYLVMRGNNEDWQDECWDMREV